MGRDCEPCARSDQRSVIEIHPFDNDPGSGNIAFALAGWYQKLSADHFDPLTLTAAEHGSIFIARWRGMSSLFLANTKIKKFTDKPRTHSPSSFQFHMKPSLYFFFVMH